MFSFLFASARIGAWISCNVILDPSDKIIATGACSYVILSQSFSWLPTHLCYFIYIWFKYSKTSVYICDSFQGVTEPTRTSVTSDPFLSTQSCAPRCVNSLRHCAHTTRVSTLSSTSLSRTYNKSFGDTTTTIHICIHAICSPLRRSRLRLLLIPPVGVQQVRDKQTFQDVSRQDSGFYTKYSWAIDKKKVDERNHKIRSYKQNNYIHLFCFCSVFFFFPAAFV